VLLQEETRVLGKKRVFNVDSIGEIIFKQLHIGGQSNSGPTERKSAFVFVNVD
jgi:hypothetical protein